MATQRIVTKTSYRHNHYNKGKKAFIIVSFIFFILALVWIALCVIGSYQQFCDASFKHAGAESEINQIWNTINLFSTVIEGTGGDITLTLSISILNIIYYCIFGVSFVMLVIGMCLVPSIHLTANIKKI
jgi:hypothetical protein